MFFIGKDWFRTSWRLVQVGVSAAKRKSTRFEEMLTKGGFIEVGAGNPQKMLKHQETSNRGEQLTLSLNKGRR